MIQKLVAFSDSIEKWTNFLIDFGFIKGGIGEALRPPPPQISTNSKARVS